MKHRRLVAIALLLLGIVALGGCEGAPCEPAPERCDGRDDDCDGQVDEAFPVGRPCDVGTGACAAAGRIACTSDGQGVACDAATSAPQAELCDGIDNDCDGQVDEPGDLAAGGQIGQPCTSAAHCGPGLTGCVAGRTECLGAQRRQDEACDGLDNDCDGVVDEAADLIAAGLVGVVCGDPKGACEGDQMGCVGGELLCVRIRQPSHEACDGLDNDCDGGVDEAAGLGAAGVGEACGSSEGACVSGALTCERGGLRCVDGIGPIDESCNGLDDDCDGILDEAVAAEGRPCDAGLGACREGRLRCVAGEAVCEGLIAPHAELCDGLDNDCDGQVDETAAGVGEVCGSPDGACVVGQLTCQAGELACAGQVGPAPELCDGVDNDCDGATDEAFAGLGEPCEREGDCRVGARLCAAGGQGLCCSADPECDPGRVVGDELCDGVDNDCDGGVDEGWQLGQACAAAGVCGAGRTECLDVHSAGCDSGPGGSRYAGRQEACDGQDDDCDGDVDEGWRVGQACDPPGRCGPGAIQCLPGGGAGCSTGPDGDAYGGRPELCDGSDDDCDGREDEGFTYANAAPGELCDGVGRCALGRVECSLDGGAAQCSTDPGGSAAQAREELCDGLDDDCDAGVDEGYPELGQACDGADGDLCRGGIVSCAADGAGAVCTGDDEGGAPDLCNGLDDDCDGTVDEVSPAQTAVCRGARGHVAVRCDGGACAVECLPGFGDDDGDLAQADGNGCEAYSGPRFTDVTAAAGVGYLHFHRLTPGVCQLNGGQCVEDFMTGGAAAGDYDGDGWVDLFVTRLDARDILFRNRGDGTFEDVSLGAGLTDRWQSNGAVFCDVDRDGDLDLHVTTMGEERFLLYVNDGAGGFDEQGRQRGAAAESDQPRAGFSVACGDYDRDGWPDLHVTENRIQGMELPGARAHVRLLRNRGEAGPGTFEDVTDAAGVSLDGLAPFAVYAYTSTFSDLDDDGWPDLLIAGDRHTSRLFWNDGAGGFIDGTEAAGVGTDDSGMGSAVGDYDGDGRLDWFVTAIHEHSFCDAPPCPLLYSGNRLYRNEGGRRFSDRTDEVGVRNGFWGWGASFLDYDNDGDLDIVATNGANSEPWNSDPMRLWRNDGGAMDEVSEAAGLDDRGDGKGLLVFDYDDDGDLDVFVVRNEDSPRLYRNDGVGDPGAGVGGWLRVRLEGGSSVRQGLGARIELHPAGGGAVQVREVRAGSNYLGQSEVTAHFGLGGAGVDRLVVRWPVSGQRQVVRSPERNSTVVVREP